jgi:phosphoribosylglycinamide formyltransferase-1
MLKLGILASHTGTNFQSILDACQEGILAARPVVAISNNSASMSLQRAARAGVPTFHLSGKSHPREEDLDTAILDALRDHQVELVVLVGYMKHLGPATLDHYRGRIINIHPALLPKYGGQGMYGMNVHKAVLASGDRESGPSIHLVNSEYDAGPVIAQRKVPVLADDSPDSLAARVLIHEHQLLVETLIKIVDGEIDLTRFAG